MSKLIVSILTNLPQNQIFNFLLPNRQIDHRRLIYRKITYTHLKLWMLPHNLIDFVDLNYHQHYLT